MHFVCCGLCLTFFSFQMLASRAIKINISWMPQKNLRSPPVKLGCKLGLGADIYCGLSANVLDMPR